MANKTSLALLFVCLLVCAQGIRADEVSNESSLETPAGDKWYKSVWRYVKNMAKKALGVFGMFKDNKDKGPTQPQQGPSTTGNSTSPSNQTNTTTPTQPEDPDEFEASDPSDEIVDETIPKPNTCKRVSRDRVANGTIYVPGMLAEVHIGGDTFTLDADRRIDQDHNIGEFDVEPFLKDMDVAPLIKEYSTEAFHDIPRVTEQEFEEVAELTHQAYEEAHQRTTFSRAQANKYLSALSSTFQGRLNVGTAHYLFTEMKKCKDRYIIHDFHSDAKRWKVEGDKFTQILDFVVVGCGIKEKAKNVVYAFRKSITGKFRNGAEKVAQSVEKVRNFTLGAAYISLTLSL